VAVTVLNPATEDPIAELPEAGVEEADAAVERAREAFPGWRAVAPADRARLLRRLATLVEEQRSVLLLVMLEGMSYREVADIQGVPIGTVMSRLARARAHVKASLEGERPALKRVK